MEAGREDEEETEAPAALAVGKGGERNAPPAAATGVDADIDGGCVATGAFFDVSDGSKEDLRLVASPAARLSASRVVEGDEAPADSVGGRTWDRARVSTDVSTLRGALAAAAAGVGVGALPPYSRSHTSIRMEERLGQKERAPTARARLPTARARAIRVSFDRSTPSALASEFEAAMALHTVALCTRLNLKADIDAGSSWVRLPAASSPPISPACLSCLPPIASSGCASARSAGFESKRPFDRIDSSARALASSTSDPLLPWCTVPRHCLYERLGCARRWGVGWLAAAASNRFELECGQWRRQAPTEREPIGHRTTTRARRPTTERREHTTSTFDWLSWQLDRTPRASVRGMRTRNSPDTCEAGDRLSVGGEHAGVRRLHLPGRWSSGRSSS